MSAQLFILRWNFRVLRREWRQHLVLFLLITTATGVGIAGVLSACNSVEPPENRYGKGEVIATVTGDTDLFEQAMVDQGHPYGIVSTGVAKLAGQSATVKVKTQDPTNDVTAPLLSLLDGRWPKTSDEVALTDRVGLDQTAVGQTIEVGGSSFEVVGLVENPTDLVDEFLFAFDIDDLAIPQDDQTALFLVDAQAADVTFPVGVESLSLESRGSLVSVRTAVTLVVNRLFSNE